jgi:glyoxylase-like metal-dependent hydrolase (beta-lactamase superfamily II)
MFSGDFIFERSVGRVDFPYSNPSDMKESLKRFKEIEYDKIVYTGHGGATTIKQEQQYVDYWIETL